MEAKKISNKRDQERMATQMVKEIDIHGFDEEMVQVAIKDKQQNCRHRPDTAKEKMQRGIEPISQLIEGRFDTFPAEFDALGICVEFTSERKLIHFYLYFLFA